MRQAFFCFATALLLAGCGPAGPEQLEPIDPARAMPARGFFMGLLPMPAEGQPLDSA